MPPTMRQQSRRAEAEGAKRRWLARFLAVHGHGPGTPCQDAPECHVRRLWRIEVVRVRDGLL